MLLHPDVHVCHDGNGRWKVKQGGRTLSTHILQTTALKIGRREARRAHVELVAHDRNGKIRAKDSFGRESPRRG